MSELEKKQKIVAIIQARMTSSRLPGKVLIDIAGQPMLLHVVNRARRAILLDDVIVAITDQPADDPIAELCLRHQIHFFRGSEHDVLDRYYHAARSHKADVLVRLTGDCPVIDPAVIDHLVRVFLDAGVDFAANRLPPPFGRTYPIGMDVEVCTLTALETAWKEATAKHDREHVMPYLYEVPGRFQTLQIDHIADVGHLRWTVDTPEDLVAVRRIFASFEGRTDFSFEEILTLYKKHPELEEINRQVTAKNYDAVDDRFKKYTDKNKADYLT